ncbi:MAG: hypothetical protein QM783_12920 [Phycisphaerales bacterium]
MTTQRTSHTAAALLALFAFGTLLPILGGCDKDTSVSKQTTTRTTSTPDGVKKTTETTEKKVEVEHKNPN